ncbi:DUF4258 domain-containing protein [Rhodoferax sp. 4810]|uniref:DUF4258 domain-containing protein n=1 Tax=Thiospirillum jenense TaxID=1653858 RepID=A0A839HQR6_9GAMM|nr:DUF4258 domain-containing protein [Thiospirillum jenense]MBB1078019.1 DUF4258 domain-containing protein [Rhodoferax jenense]MBB1127362.1 DUF4258 domain-containing protein [Thiospirillum jenense]
MNFTLSQHAEKMVREREINLAWLSATLHAPDISQSDQDDPTLVHVWRRIPEFGNRFLRVIYNHTTTPPHIVTVYFDRSIKGKR